MSHFCLINLVHLSLWPKDSEHKPLLGKRDVRILIWPELRSVILWWIMFLIPMALPQDGPYVGLLHFSSGTPRTSWVFITGVWSGSARLMLDIMLFGGNDGNPSKIFLWVLPENN